MFGFLAKARKRTRPKPRPRPIHGVADKYAPEFRRAFLDANAQLRKVDKEQLRLRIQRSDPFSAVQTMPWERFVSTFERTVLDASTRTILEGAELAARGLPKRLDIDPIPLALRASRAPRTIRTDALNTLALAKGVRGESFEALRVIVDAAMKDSPDRATLADRLVSELTRRAGVTRVQARTLERVRASLTEQGMENGTIQKRLNDLTARMIRQRADNIARHQSMLSASAGQHATWLQAVEEGYLDPDVEREWFAFIDGRTCDRCKALNGQRRKLNEEFEASDGTKVLHPPLHPGTCRCTVVLHLPDDE